jgi:hypothetical protein
MNLVAAKDPLHVETKTASNCEASPAIDQSPSRSVTRMDSRLTTPAATSKASPQKNVHACPPSRLATPKSSLKRNRVPSATSPPRSVSFAPHVGTSDAQSPKQEQGPRTPSAKKAKLSFGPLLPQSSSKLQAMRSPQKSAPRNSFHEATVPLSRVQTQPVGSSSQPMAKGTTNSTGSTTMPKTAPKPQTRTIGVQSVVTPPTDLDVVEGGNNIRCSSCSHEKPATDFQRYNAQYQTCNRCHQYQFDSRFDLQNNRTPTDPSQNSELMPDRKCHRCSVKKPLSEFYRKGNPNYKICHSCEIREKLFSVAAAMAARDGILMETAFSQLTENHADRAFLEGGHRDERNQVAQPTAPRDRSSSAEVPLRHISWRASVAEPDGVVNHGPMIQTHASPRREVSEPPSTGNTPEKPTAQRKTSHVQRKASNVKKAKPKQVAPGPSSVVPDQQPPASEGPPIAQTRPNFVDTLVLATTQCSTPALSHAASSRRSLVSEAPAQRHASTIPSSGLTSFYDLTEDEDVKDLKIKLEPGTDSEPNEDDLRVQIRLIELRKKQNEIEAQKAKLELEEFELQEKLKKHRHI